MYDLLGADTLYISQSVPLEAFSFAHPNGKYYFVNKVIKPKHIDSGVIFSGFALPQGCEALSMIFRKCIFEDNQISNLKKTNSILTGDFVFDRCKMWNLNLAKIRGYLEFYNSFCGNLSILNSDRLNIRFENMASSEVKIEQCSDLYLEFVNHFNKESSKYTVSNSKIRFLKFDLSDKYGSFKYEFNNDTIKNIQFDNGKNEDAENYRFESYAHEIIFRRCYIANPMDFKSRAPDTKIKFIDCTFGPSFNLTNLRIDYLALDNSQNIPNPLKIKFASDTIWGQISLVNTEVNRLEIEWTDKMWLYFDSVQTTEIIDRTFNSLLDKYRAELRTDYYRRIDLMHHYYSEDAFFWNLDQHWWGHGYKKNLVFLWTGVLLLLFTMTNFIWWPQMQSVYSLFPMKRVFSFKSYLTLKSFFAAFLYSAFIFFSLSIKLDRLKLARTEFVAWFLIQYLSGLFCLLFIVKAIFKW